LSLQISNILKGVVLLGGIAHVMIFMNGYWNDALWMSVILNVGIPMVIYKYLKMGNKKKRTIRLPPKEF
jgi:hypothetical protein